MDQTKFSTIAHKQHQFYNPIRADKVDQIIDLLNLNEASRVLDVGAGKGEILFRLIHKYGASCTAIERTAAFADQCRKEAENKGMLSRLTIYENDAKEILPTLSPSYNAAVCIGASHAIGTYKDTLNTLSGLVIKGGYVLVGEGFWAKKPNPAYLSFLGAEEQELLSHSENVLFGDDYGLTPIWSVVSSQDEWDAYEWLYSKSIEDYCYYHPEDTDCPEMLAKIKEWRKHYLQYGRETLGFALYLFRKQ
ncbi:SAM-dependent methyltransferase [Pontibacillus salicampi]|uniref:SAM-dependent methyltransferase n=1 Tax=Pontibacillus salicampi TaxID=1449801 RepID=A0ABV6LRA2_9BACI